EDAAKAAQAQREQREINDELKAAPATAMASKRRVSQTETQIKKLEGEMRPAIDEHNRADAAAKAAEKDENEAKRDAAPVAGTALRTDNEVTRDNNAAINTRTIADDARATKTRAGQHVGEIADETAALKEKLPAEKAQAERDSTDANIVREAMGAGSIEES